VVLSSTIRQAGQGCADRYLYIHSREVDYQNLPVRLLNLATDTHLKTARNFANVIKIEHRKILEISKFKIQRAWHVHAQHCLRACVRCTLEMEQIEALKKSWKFQNSNTCMAHACSCACAGCTLEIEQIEALKNPGNFKIQTCTFPLTTSRNKSERQTQLRSTPKIEPEEFIMRLPCCAT
jgi:hypothetical protein